MAEMLQHLATDHRIERFIRIRNRVNLHIAQAEGDTLSIGIRVGRRLILDVERMAFMPEFQQQRQEQTVPGSYVQHPMRISQRHGDVAKPVDASFKNILQFGISPAKQPAFIVQPDSQTQQIVLGPCSAKRMARAGRNGGMVAGFGSEHLTVH
jgi:hypothetical protein